MTRNDSTINGTIDRSTNLPLKSHCRPNTKHQTHTIQSIKQIMAKRGRPPKKKKQATITAFTSATPSSTSSSRGRKKSIPTTTAKANANDNDDDLPKARTWIYSTHDTPAASAAGGDNAAAAANDNNAAAVARIIGSEEGYEHYLNTRVQRPVVRSLPNNLSYFDNDNDNSRGANGGSGGGGLKCEEDNEVCFVFGMYVFNLNAGICFILCWARIRKRGGGVCV